MALFSAQLPFNRFKICWRNDKVNFVKIFTSLWTSLVLYLNTFVHALFWVKAILCSRIYRVYISTIKWIFTYSQSYRGMDLLRWPLTNSIKIILICPIISNTKNERIFIYTQITTNNQIESKNHSYLEILDNLPWIQLSKKLASKMDLDDLIFQLMVHVIMRWRLKILGMWFWK